MIDFQKLYRKCERMGLLKGRADALESFINKGEGRFSVSEANPYYLDGVDGFVLEIDSCRAFFPRVKASDIEKRSDPYYWKEGLSKGYFVIPIFARQDFVDRFSNALSGAEENAEIECVVNLFCKELYTSEKVASLVSEVRSRTPLFSGQARQIEEAVYAHYMGLGKVAITALLPCIEQMIRIVGKAIGYTCDLDISKDRLLDLLRRLQNRIIKEIIFHEYTWVPKEMLVAQVVSKVNEWVATIEHFKSFIENVLYPHTHDRHESVTLNRHGILHGFITEYASPNNFYRLLAVLSNLQFFSLLVGCGGSVHPPKTTQESKIIVSNIEKIYEVSSVINMA